MKKKIMIIIGILAVIAVVISFLVALKNQESGSVTSTSNYTNAKEITEGGSYEITGENECIVINTTSDVELKLNNATITCNNGPAINIEKANEVNIILTGENTITSKTTENLEGAIFSKEDLILSGDGKLTITSNYDGIVSKDSLMIKGGTYIIDSDDDGIKGKDDVVIENGDFTITSSGDGIQSTNTEESDKGTITIQNGTFKINSVGDAIQAQTTLTIIDGDFNIKTTGDTSINSTKALKAETQLTIEGGKYNINTTDDGIHSNGNITINNGEIKVTSKDDAIHADGLVEINGGELTLDAAEGIEGTYVKINNGEISINASDDGINAGQKSNAYTPTIEMNGGTITIKMGSGDTDAIDSNGNIYINGGTINITANSPFDYDGEGKYTNGTLIINGEETTQISNQMMGRGNPNQNNTRRGYGMK